MYEFDGLNMPNPLEDAAYDVLILRDLVLDVTEVECLTGWVE
jgi:hypothetical protein